MIRNNKIKKAFVALCSLFLVIVIIFSPLAYNLYNFSFYSSLYEKNGVYEVIDRQDAEKLTESVFGFFKSGAPFEKFELKGGVQYFNSSEVSHLNDVRILLSRILLVFYVSSILLILFTLILIEKCWTAFIKNLGIIMTASSAFVLVFLAALYVLASNFSHLFENFHYIFFPQGNWAFPEGSLIITIFPFGFFYDFFFSIVMSSLITSVVLFAAGIGGIITVNKIQKRINNEK
jgi:integral membrane protein (TIGR01906 family)